MDSPRIILIFTFILFSFTACSSTPRENRDIGEMLVREVGDLDPDLAAHLMATPPKTRSRSRARIEGEIKREVWWWVRYFTVRERDQFSRTLERAEIYRPMVQSALVEAKLPKELIYLAFIESAYVNHATSPAQAVGIWQFMEPTAKRYGLQVSAPNDERKHPVAATFAAVRYLKFLHQRFNSWYLAIAAYNAGEGRIERAIRRGRSTDFWSLADRGYLPKETIAYLPKFLAAATVGAHLGAFGFNDKKPTYQWPGLTTLHLPSGMGLARVSKQTGMTPKELIYFNPSIKRKLLNRYRKWVEIRVPETAALHYLELKDEFAGGPKKSGHPI